jgi:beta-lactamase class A
MDLTLFFSRLKIFDLLYALYYKSEKGQPLFFCNHNRFLAASIIKIPLLLTWVHLERAGEVDRAELCCLDDEPQVRGAGLAYLLCTRQLPYQDVLMMMIALSDNLCANLVIQRIGMARAQEVIHDELKLPGTTLQRKLMDFEARAAGLENWITAEDCIRLFDLLNELNPEERKWVDSILRACQDDFLLLRDLPRDTVHFRHKTGSLPGVLHDWGYTNDRRIFMLTQNVKDELAVFHLFGEFGQLLLDERTGAY